MNSSNEHLKLILWFKGSQSERSNKIGQCFQIAVCDPDIFVTYLQLKQLTISTSILNDNLQHVTLYDNAVFNKSDRKVSLTFQF